VLSGWATEIPWRAFVGTTAVALPIAAAVGGLATGALWAGTDALRRRAGVPFWPAAGPAAPHAARDAILFGAALGLAPAALSLLAPVARAGAWPESPSTTLDRLAPWAVHALRTLQSFGWAPLAALPAAALAAGARTWRARLGVLVGLALVTAAATAAAEAGGGTPAPLAALGAVGGLALTALLAWAFGRGSAVPWLAAPPAAAVALGLAAARVASNGTDRASALLGAAAGAAVLAALYRAAARPRGAPGGVPINGRTV
jgi:hypothetical protein